MHLTIGKMTTIVPLQCWNTVHDLEQLVIIHVGREVNSVRKQTVSKLYLFMQCFINCFIKCPQPCEATDSFFSLSVFRGGCWHGDFEEHNFFVCAHALLKMFRKTQAEILHCFLFTVYKRKSIQTKKKKIYLQNLKNFARPVLISALGEVLCCCNQLFITILK